MTQTTSAAMPPPTDFVCPLTNSVMKDPVQTAFGMNFEREAILKWLTLRSTCPVTGTPLHKEYLETNAKLQWKIKYWQFKNNNNNGDGGEPQASVVVDSQEQPQTAATTVRPAPRKRFLCPLTNQVMSEPVAIREGVNFEKEALLKFIEKHGEISPYSGQPLGRPNFYPNGKLQWEIRHWVLEVKEQEQQLSQQQPEKEVVAVSQQPSVKADKDKENTPHTSSFRTYEIPIATTKTLDEQKLRSGVQSRSNSISQKAFLEDSGIMVGSGMGENSDFMSILDKVCEQIHAL